MKNLLCLCFAFVFANLGLQAQRVAYVDMNAVLAAIPEYSQAQRELDELSERWRQDMSKEYDKIGQMYQEFQARQPLMSDEARKQKEEEIIAKETSLRELQKKRFGPDGELFQRRQTLVKPIQEKVFRVIEQYAKDLNYEFIFTAPDGSTIIYAKPEKDITNEITKLIKK